MKTVLVGLFLVFQLNVFSQEKRIEEIYQECMYNSLSDNGETLKRYAKQFENHLIEIKILKDKSPESYYDIYKAIANGKRYPSYYEYSYIDSINKIERNKINPSNKKCSEYVISLSSFTGSKMEEINNAVMSLSDNRDYRFSEIISKIRPIMDVKDFELEFYKHKTYMYLYLSEDILFPED